MRLRGSRTPDADVTGLFDRSAAGWERLGAPVSLYDVDEAARCWRMLHPDRVMVDAGEGRCFRPPDAVCAGRWWRLARPFFLAEVDSLTRDERVRMERWPLAAPGRGLDFDDLAAALYD